jgi:hypothetical protein
MKELRCRYCQQVFQSSAYHPQQTVCKQRLPAIVPKDKFVEVHLELGLTHTVVGADEHCWKLSTARSAKGTIERRTSHLFVAPSGASWGTVDGPPLTTTPLWLAEATG